MIKSDHLSWLYPGLTSERNLTDFGNALITNNLKLEQDASSAKLTQRHQMSWLLPLAKLNNVPCSHDMGWQDLLTRVSTHLIHQGASYD